MLKQVKAELNNNQQKNDIKQVTVEELSQNDLATIAGGKYAMTWAHVYL